PRRLTDQLHRPAVRLDDGLDQREAEADPALPVTGRVAAREPLERDRQQVGWKTRTVVADLEPVGMRGDRDRGAGGGVLAGVGQQVGDDLVQACLVTGDLDRYGVRGELELPAVVGR